MADQLWLHGVVPDCRAVPCAHCPRITVPVSYLCRDGVLAEGLDPRPLCDACTRAEVKRRISERLYVSAELMALTEGGGRG